MNIFLRGSTIIVFVRMKLDLGGGDCMIRNVIQGELKCYVSLFGERGAKLTNINVI